MCRLQPAGYRLTLRMAAGELRSTRDLSFDTSFVASGEYRSWTKGVVIAQEKLDTSTHEAHNLFRGNLR